MKKLLGVCFTFALLFVLAACNGEDADTKEVALTTEEVTVQDALGKEITLKEAPTKIVSLMPSNTEILFELGLGEFVVGVNESDNYPSEVENIETVGNMEFDLEKIISLQPDLVLAHESGLYGLGDGITQLESAGIPVFVVENAVNFEETYTTIEQIGQLTYSEQKAKQINESIQQQLKEIEDKVNGAEQKSVFVVVGAEPDIYAAGTGTFIDEMLKELNVTNAVQQPDWPMYSAEDFVASDADVILTTYEPDIESLKNNEQFASMKAIQNNQLFIVDGDTTTRQGPRLAEGVKSIAKAIYPNLFNE